MKNIRTYFNHTLILFLSIATLCSCDKLELQRDYKYESKPLDPHINMTAWEFMNSRVDIFSLMIEAVEYTAMEENYSQTDEGKTYLFIDDTGMRAFLTRGGFTLITQVDKGKMTKFLQYHTIVGGYHAYDKKLPIEPIYVKTLLDGEDGLMTIKVNKSSANSVGSPIANGNIVVNETASNFLSSRISSISSNIMPTNGVIHVFSAFSLFRKDANYTPAY